MRTPAEGLAAQGHGAPAPGAPEGDGGGSGGHTRQGTPAAPAEPEVADSDKEKDTAPADSEHYSLDDILAEFSDF